MAGSFEGQVAVITGGASGLGRATATRLGSEGADIVIADLDEQRGAEVVASIETLGQRPLLQKRLDLGKFHILVLPPERIGLRMSGPQLYSA